MAQAAEYKFGRTTVRVMDDACKSPAEVEEILRRLSRLASRANLKQPAGNAHKEAPRSPSPE